MFPDAYDAFGFLLHHLPGISVQVFAGPDGFLAWMPGVVAEPGIPGTHFREVSALKGVLVSDLSQVALREMNDLNRTFYGVCLD